MWQSSIQHIPSKIINSFVTNTTNTMKVQTVVILAVLVTLAALNMVQSQETPQVYCGRRLAMTLALLCDNGMLIKRSEPSMYGYRHEKMWPWMAPHMARSMDRGKRQVVSECCDKPCTVDELLSYCANWRFWGPGSTTVNLVTNSWFVYMYLKFLEVRNISTDRMFHHWTR